MRLQPSTLIRDSYTLEKLIGVGASGEVWKARDSDQQVVAIKFMNENLLHGEKARKHRQRLEREIYALGLLQHPNIPRLHDYDLDFARPFVVMDYIDSPSFEYLLSSGAMLYVPVTERLRLLRDIASALTSAHDAGIIHRDIKPGNIHGIETPYLLDFSVALEEESLEHTNFNVGTTIYMTPGGELPDRLADNYSFAVVAYEVLYGEHPIFPKDDETRTMGTYSRIVAFNRLKSGDWRMPGKLQPYQIPFDLRAANTPVLDAIFSRAFGDPAHRYAHLSEFISDLSSAILNEETYELIRQMPKAPPVSAQTPPQPREVPVSESFTMLEVEATPAAAAPPTPTALDAPAPQPAGAGGESVLQRLRKGFRRLLGNR